MPRPSRAGRRSPRAVYYVHGATTSVFLTREGIVFALTSSSRDGWAVRLDFEGANPDVRIVGRERTDAVVSYLKGSRSDWKAALPSTSPPGPTPASSASLTAARGE